MHQLASAALAGSTTTRQKLVPLIDPTTEELEAAPVALLTDGQSLYKAGVTSKVVLAPAGRVKDTIDLQCKASICAIRNQSAGNGRGGRVRGMGNNSLLHTMTY
jgi:hypothetical protein